MEVHEFEHSDSRHSVSIPLAFFDKLLKCYYGNGPRADEKNVDRAPESPAAEIIETTDSLRDLQISTGLPKGFEPKGVALRKIEAQNAGRQDQTAEE